MVFTLRNDNVGDEVEGTVLREVSTNKVINTLSRPGMVLIFDNIRFRHSVPELKKPRKMVGLRSWDVSPAYFLDTPQEGVDWKKFDDSVNPGFIRMIDTTESTNRQVQYLEERWPSHWEEIKRQGSVF
jgi:hypothetical protein